MLTMILIKAILIKIMTMIKTVTEVATKRVNPLGGIMIGIPDSLSLQKEHISTIHILIEANTMVDAHLCEY